MKEESKEYSDGSSGEHCHRPNICEPSYRSQRLPRDSDWKYPITHRTRPGRVVSSSPLILNNGTASTNLTIVKENRNNSINRLRRWLCVSWSGGVGVSRVLLQYTSVEVKWKGTGVRADFDIMSETRPNLDVAHFPMTKLPNPV